MRKEPVVLGAALLLCGCTGYFDQHPANVRPESEAAATVLGRRQPPAQVAETVLSPPVEPQTIVPAGRAPSAGSLPERRSAEPVASAVISGPPAKAPAAPAAPVATARPPALVATGNKSGISAPVLERPVQPRAQSAAPVAAIEKPPAPVENAAPPSAAAAAPSELTAPIAVQTVPERPPSFAPAPAGAAVPRPFSPEVHCEAVARQRAEDAAANGLDRDTQEIVRRGAYGNCLAWDAAHPPH